MSRRDKHLTDDMPEIENSVSEPVSDATQLYDSEPISDATMLYDSEQVSDATQLYNAVDLKDAEQADQISEEAETEQTPFTGEGEEAVLPSEIAEAETHEKKGNPFVRFFRWIRSWKIWVKILALCLILALMTGGVVAATAYKAVEDVVVMMNENAEIPDDYDLGIQPINGFINILLLGTDARDMNSDDYTRSDMIMVASINVETYEVTLTSIYRDTMLKLGDTSTYDKITHAFFYGGPEMTIKSINQALDLNIQHYAIVNFNIVADIVEAVGGITVNVEDYEIDELNKYTIQSANLIGKKDYKLVTEPGEQTLDGAQAVSYGRIRKGVGDDFKRTERMRIVVTKVFEKMKTMKFSELKKIVKIIAPQVKTNLKLTDILALGKDVTKYSISTGAGFPYSVATGNYNNVSYVFATDLAGDVMKLHTEVFGQEGYVTSSMVDEISYGCYSRYANRGDTNTSEEEQKEEEKPETKPEEKPDTPAHTHSYSETSRVEPTCTSDGYIEYSCSCGDSYRETLGATGHSYQETGRVEPTATEDGYVEYTCTICGETYTETLPATGGGEDPGTGEGGEGGDGGGEG